MQAGDEGQGVRGQNLVVMRSAGPVTSTPGGTLTAVVMSPAYDSRGSRIGPFAGGTERLGHPAGRGLVDQRGEPALARRLLLGGLDPEGGLLPVARPLRLPVRPGRGVGPDPSLQLIRELLTERMVPQIRHVLSTVPLLEPGMPAGCMRPAAVSSATFAMFGPLQLLPFRRGV